MSSRPSEIVLSERQMAALADPLRSEIVLSLRAYGRGSAADLANRLAVDVKTLYYPLKLLMAANLVKRAGVQKGKRRRESVFALAADRFAISRDASLDLRAKLIKTTLKTAEREFLAVQALGDQVGATPPGLMISRSQLWLEPNDREKLLERLQQLAEEFSARSKVGQGELLSWTSLVSPVVI